MSLRSDALTIKNETSDDANTANRVGGFLESTAKIVETVDTIADLRAFDKSILSNGDIIQVKAHGTDGLNDGHGGGFFTYRDTPLFSINNVGGYTAGTYNTATVTPTTTGFALPALGTYTSQLPKVVFDNGVIGTLQQTGSLAGDREISIATGTTELWINFDGDVPDGASAYYVDDDGVRIRPTSGGDGYYQRRIDDHICTPEMYGAIPNFSSKDGAVNECSAAIQAAF